MSNIHEEVTSTEENLVLGAYRDFRKVVKDRHMGGELRIAIEIDRETGEPEIIFAGYNFKRSLDATRAVYRKRKQSLQQTFGGSERR